MKLHPLWGWRHSKTGLWHSAGDSWDRTQGQQQDDAGKGSAGLFLQMPGWVTVPGKWHTSGHTPWVAELQTVALLSDEAGISSPASRLCTGCFPWGMPEAGNSSVPLQRHKEPQHEPTSGITAWKEAFCSLPFLLCFLTALMSTVTHSQLPAQ